MKSYIVDTSAKVSDISSALDVGAGLPVRGQVVGGPDRLPQAYAPGAAGWTAKVCSLPLDGGDGTAALEIPPEADVSLGKTFKVAGKDVQIPTAAAKVPETLLPAKFVKPPGTGILSEPVGKNV